VSVTYLRKGQALREAVKRQLQARIDEGLLTQLALGKSCNVYIDPERLESQAPRSIAQVRILSPFDNLVIQRQRCREVFAFDFQIECYVPGPLRQFGYFCLPLLYRDRLVGRIDCKAHRAQARLEVKSIHIDKPVGEDFPELMSAALISFASFNSCEQIDIVDAHHVGLARMPQPPLNAG
jgi:uncharacterized protein YcaQ